MHIQIDLSIGRPVYQQIIDQVKRDIALGRLKEGERLATVRELAAQLAINPNTIGKAYKQLERENIIVTRPGAGAFVASTGSDISSSVRKRIICDDLERVIVEAVHMQIDKQTLARWFNERIEKFKFSVGKG
jgi:GntR family transcriptional regulator